MLEDGEIQYFQVLWYWWIESDENAQIKNWCFKELFSLRFVFLKKYHFYVVLHLLKETTICSNNFCTSSITAL